MICVGAPRVTLVKEIGSMKRSIVPGLLVMTLTVVGAVSLWKSAGQASESESSPTPAAVERARKQVKMLDHIYKTTVVLITDKYVDDEADFPAGSAAVALFKSVTDAGFHRVRLIDVTGKPYEEKNVARDDVEKEGVRQLKSGKAVFEKIETVDGKPLLRVLTAIPVVSKKCVMCHAHYADVKEGEAIGAISYSVPIE